MQSTTSEALCRSRGHMKLFLANTSILQLIIIIYFTFTAGCFRTIEKRFELTSTESGFLSSLGDIIESCLVIFIAFLGSKVNKARLLSVLLFFAGCGSLLNAVPYFVYGPKDTLTSSSGDGDNRTDPHGLQVCSLGGPDPDGADACLAGRGEHRANTWAYDVLLAGSALVGLGTTCFTSLSVSYLDENVATEDVGVYLGVLSGALPLAPIIGFSMAAALLRQPESLKGSQASPDNPNWIGAWWLGYVITGGVFVIFSITLFFFPKHSETFYKKRADALRTVGEQTATTRLAKTAKLHRNIVLHLKEFLNALKRLATNATYMCIVGSYVCLLYITIGVFRNLTRYMEIHFRQSAYMANIVSAICIGGTGALGVFLGGFLMKRFRITPLGSAKIFVVCVMVGVVGTFANMWVACDPVDMAGTLDPDTGRLDVNQPCAGNCSCELKGIHPVCVNDSVQFFSPCHAGCHVFSPKGTSQNSSSCLCAPVGGAVSRGYCQGQCSLVIVYAVIMCLTIFVSSIARVPVIILGLRVIDEDLKPVSIAIQTFAGNIFAFIPGPVIYGRLIDSTCLVWQRSCGRDGACLFYNTDRFRYIMHGVTAAILLVGGGLFSVVTYLLVRRDTRRGRWSGPTSRPTSQEAAGGDAGLNTSQEAEGRDAAATQPSRGTDSTSKPSQDAEAVVNKTRL